MTSVRLDPDLERRMRQAADARGESISDFIRRAVAERVDETLTEDPLTAFADVLGIVHTDGGRAERTSDAFAEELLRARHT